MKTQRLAIGLSILNVVILACTAFGSSSSVSGTVVPVLRARALEIVDARGHVRAEIRIFPADPNVKLPDGSRGYPETVLLRLSDSEGAPNVKLAATEDGSALALGGEPEGNYIQLMSRGASPFVKVVTKGTERVLNP
ncbi:MAG TPA: hypothetical protein VF761_13240 [Gemmatimonadaceae bacterium]